MKKKNFEKLPPYYHAIKKQDLDKKTVWRISSNKLGEIVFVEKYYKPITKIILEDEKK